MVPKGEEDTRVSNDVNFQQILVMPKSGQLEVTFDDNKNSNIWSYHQGNNFPHITGWFSYNVSVYNLHGQF